MEDPAEALMFHLKHRFHFEQVMRRGIENVRAELLEKACKMIHRVEKKTTQTSGLNIQWGSVKYEQG